MMRTLFNLQEDVMRRTLAVLGLVGLLGGVPYANAANIVQNDKFTLDANGRLQWLAVGQHVKNDFSDDGRLYLFMKQARLRFAGKFEGIKFDIQWAYGGEDLVATSTGVGLSLQDFSFDVPLFGGNTWVKIGQFRVPYSRERLTDSGTLSFGDRSVQNLGFSWNRDVGAALHTYQGKFAGTFGVFTGGGRDVPQRYLPERLGFPMIVARLGYTDGVDEDIYDVRARPTKLGQKQKALFVNAMYLNDTLIGHSTVINTRLTDKSLLINSNWNPFVAQTPYTKAEVWQAGADAVVRAPMGSFTASVEAEANYAKFSNSYGRLVLKGGRLQVGASKQSVDLNLRYAVLFPDTRMANTYTPAAGGAPRHSSLVTDDKPMQEITPSFTYHYKSNVKGIVDFPILIDMIVFEENSLGSYLASDQPDQASLVKPGTTRAGTVKRQTVPAVRVLLQFTF